MSREIIESKKILPTDQGAARPPAVLKVIKIHIFVIKHLLETRNGNKLDIKADKCVMSKITVI